MKIMKPSNIHVSFHYKVSSSLGLVYNEEKIMSRILCVSSVGSLLDVMKWLISYISHSFDVIIYMENSIGVVKWVLHSFRGTSVTYNGFNCLMCDNCNLDFTGISDRRRSTLTYVSKNYLGRHVGGGVIPEKIHILGNCTRVHETSVIREATICVWLLLACNIGDE
jgi:hypothetical protein